MVFRRFVLPVALVALMTACPEDPASGPDGGTPDADVASDVATETVGDAPHVDAAPDVTAEVDAQDTLADGQPDGGGPDVADAQPEVTTSDVADASPDSVEPAPDTADTAPDGADTAEAGPEVADGPADVPDAAPDVPSAADVVDADATPDADAAGDGGPVDVPADGDGGPGDGGDADGGSALCGTLYPTYRDFEPLHVDFGCHMWGNSARPGLIMSAPGVDGKPVYNPAPPTPPVTWSGSTPQITSEQSFSDWYTTKAGTNIELSGEIQLVETTPGVFAFTDTTFYPLTDQGFGNNVTPNWAGETFPNWNGAFTTEIHAQFQYQAGQYFSFVGDDDVWVFIDGQLVIDLGGLHGPVTGMADLDTLGLVEGNFYTLDVFHAERCGSGSNFAIETSIACLQPQ